jgi:putative chitinase
MLTLSLSGFYAAIRPFFGGQLSQSQVDNFQLLLGLGVARCPSLEALAYVLATVRHEAGAGMAPVREVGRGEGYDYGKHLDMGRGPGHRTSYTTPDELYYGRGHIQLTWRCNYVAMGRLVGADLLTHPDLMLTPAVSAQVAIEGMMRGSFTGRKLADYFGPGVTPDPYNARRIINGLDRAELIARYYAAFLGALQAANTAALVKLNLAATKE